MCSDLGSLHSTAKARTLTAALQVTATLRRTVQFCAVGPGFADVGYAMGWDTRHGLRVRVSMGTGTGYGC